MAALIIAGDNLQFKSVKKTYGMEGEGFIANIYLNNKKVGVYNDFADGSGGYPVFDTVEAEKRVDSLIAEWTAKSTDKTVKALFEADPRIIDFSFLAEELINIVEDEKLFKRGIKKGYKCLARNDRGTCVQYPSNWSIEEVRKDMEKEGLTTLYTELKDFIHII